MSIVSGKMVFYYMTRDSLSFLTLCEESYPKRTAFLYLEEIADTILQELLREFGNGVRSGGNFFDVLYPLLLFVPHLSSLRRLPSLLLMVITQSLTS